jgi:hypothetical protein
MLRDIHHDFVLVDVNLFDVRIEVIPAEPARLFDVHPP